MSKVPTFTNVGGVLAPNTYAGEKPRADLREAWQMNGPVIEIDKVKAGVIQRAAISAEADRRVFAATPQQQLNEAFARANELTLLKIDNGEWTEAEQAEADDLADIRSTVKNIRVREAELKAMSDDDLVAIDPTEDQYWA